MVLILPWLSACGQGEVGLGETTPVGVTLHIPAGTSVSTAPAGLSKFFAPAPANVVSVSLSVTNAEGVELDSTTVGVTPGDTVTIQLDVTSGLDRTVIVEAFDTTGNLLYRGRSEPLELEPGVFREVTVQLENVAVSISPSEDSVLISGERNFKAVVTGFDDPSVLWSVNDIEGGDEIVGTITQDNPATYTAPSTAPEPDTVTIQATTLNDPILTATATVTILTPQSLFFVNAADGVDSQDCGTEASPCKTLSQGLFLAGEGHTVQAAPGIYDAANGEDFPLQLKPGVTLRGDPVTQGAGSESPPTLILGGGDNPFEEPGTTTAAVLCADNATLTGFTLIDPNKLGGHGMICNNTSPTIRSNTIVGNSGPAISLLGTAAPQITDNTITGNQTGIETFDTSAPSIINNTIVGNQTGIETFDTSAPSIINNTIISNGTGIETTSTSAPRIEGNIMTFNVVGMRVSHSSTPDLGGGAQGSTGGNTISCNQFADLANGTSDLVSARNNFWDHVPPTNSAEVGFGAGVDLSDSSENFEGPPADTTGAQLAPLPCKSTLSGGGVSPASGDVSMNFTYSMTYADP